MTLVRTNHHLSRIGDLNELLQSILADVVTTMGAQRGAIILADPVTGELTLRGLFSPGLPPLNTGRPYSRTLIDRCFRLGESLLCRDADADQLVRGPGLVGDDHDRAGGVGGRVPADGAEQQVALDVRVDPLEPLGRQRRARRSHRAEEAQVGLPRGLDAGLLAPQQVGGARTEVRHAGPLGKAPQRSGIGVRRAAVVQQDRRLCQ